MNFLPVMEGLHSAEALNPAFLAAFFRRARHIEQRPQDFAGALEGRIIAHVFEEPSTRTRLSFESAAHRLGARVLTVADPKTSSTAKGESLADSARVLGGYADLLVLRHPRDGASRLAAQVAGVPIINGGDGRLGHPTQTLVDLYTLQRRWETFSGRTVALAGDLLHGRTARSLAWGLAILGVRVVLLPAPGLDWESSFEQRMMDRFQLRLSWCRHPLFRTWTGNDEARVLEPRGLMQPTLFPEDVPLVRHLDALYLTRLQAERGAETHDQGYCRLTLEQAADPLLAECLVLHPLPRREELPAAFDHDPRAIYFEQAHMGPVVRQAVFLAMLAEDRYSLPALSPLPAGNPEHDLGECPNDNCVSRAEGLPAPWRVVGSRRRSFLCAYCDSLLPADYAGCRSTHRVHPLHSPAAMRIRPENLRPFRVREAAEAHGFTWGG